MASTYFFSGETSQQTGQIYAGGGNWRATYENDTWIPLPGLTSGSPNDDKYRTAAFSFGMTGGKLKGANIGMNIFTGAVSGKASYTNIFPENKPYRFGGVYLGYKNARLGYNSEKNIRGPIQNGFHTLMNNYPHFKVLDIRSRIYGGIYTFNPYTLW